MISLLSIREQTSFQITTKWDSSLKVFEFIICLLDQFVGLKQLHNSKQFDLKVFRGKASGL